MGTGIFEDTSVTMKQQSLRQELVEITRTERTLDDLIQGCTLQLKHLTEDETNQRYPSLGSTGLQRKGMGSLKMSQTVIAVKAPPETKLEVPDFNEVSLHLKSTNGPIEVYLCPEGILEDSPVKESSFPVPSLQDSSDGTDPSPGKGNDRFLDMPHHLLQQTEDQLPYSDPTPFVGFSPPLDQEDYLWGLEGGEGVSDLFEAYDLGDLLKN
uniref:E2F transcription factor 2 n=1 Tax=Pelusios castaneus TaxID=367368 RepID=A0A8C8RA40_9SAUR